MNEEFCPECGAKITGRTGFCSECGAATTSFKNQMEETKEIKRIGNLQKWYHKPDKSHLMSLIYSAFLPFSGNLYLRENIINLVLTILSILFILGNIIGLLTVSDFYLHYPHLILIYIIWWIISMVSLIYFIFKYNRRDIYYKKNDEKFSSETQLPNLFNKEYIKYIPFVITILFLIVNTGVMFSDSPKTFETSDFTIQYPHEYSSDGKMTFNDYSNRYQCTIESKTGNDNINIIKFQAYQSINDYVDEVSHVRYYDGSGYDNINKGTINIDDTEAHVIQEKDSKQTNVMFIKNDQLYQLIFNGNSQKDMDAMINSIKFK